MSKTPIERFNDTLAAPDELPASPKSTAKATTSTHIRASVSPRPEPVTVAENAAPKEDPIRRTPRPQSLYDRAMRDRWLEEHDVRTEMLDGGVGCCWFAQQGDEEDAACGQTEEEAIAKLAQDKNLPWPPARLAVAAI